MKNWCKNISGAIVLLLLHFHAFSQKVEEVRLSIIPLDTNKEFLQENISYQKKLKDYILWKLEAKKIISTLQEKSFLGASIDSVGGDSNKVKLYLTTGKKYNWIKLKKGNISEESLSKSGYRSKYFHEEPFRQEELIKLFDGIVSHYETNGYPFATISLDSIQFVDKGISAKLKLITGPLLKVDSIVIKGDANITDAYIQNYIGIKPGDLYDDEKISRIPNRIKELPFLQEKSDFLLTFTEDKVKIHLFLEKRNASRFNGILGVLPDDEGKILLTGDLQLFLQNSFGKGEIISLNWKKLQKQTQDLEFKFSYPFLFDTPFGFDYDLNLYKRDTSFITLDHIVGTRYSLRGNNFFKVFFNSRITSVLSEEGLRNLPPGQKSPYGDVTSNSYGIGFHFEKLDYRLNPRKGYEVETGLSIGQKKIKQSFDPEGDTLEPVYTQYNGNIKASLYFPLGSRSVIKIGNQSAITQSDEIFENELFRIGGLHSLRGFDEESINTSLYTIGTLEYRFILEQNSYFHLFYDMAYYENNSRSTSVIDTPLGFGGGVSFETNAGIFSLSYALGKQFDNPILLRASKVHFGFVNYF